MSVLADPPSLILATKLIDLAIFTDPAVAGAFPIYVSLLPDGDEIENDAAAIYDTKGDKDGRLMKGDNILHYGVQVKVRSRTYAVGWDKINAVAAAFEPIDQATTVSVGGSGGTAYKLVNISQTSPPLSMGLEEGTKRRNLFTVNFLCTLTEV